jgi:hypothetical protein
MLALAVSATVPAFAGPNVGVSINVNQPGVYGRIDIGNYPPPTVVYPQPLIIVPAPVAVYQRPIYLHVPVVYQQNWGQYCGRYAACGQPVYFVQERWYNDEYLPRHLDCNKNKCKPEKFKKEKHERGKHGKHHGNDD